jgi:hypothetical protein
MNKTCYELLWWSLHTRDLFIVLSLDMTEKIYREINVLETWVIMGGATYLLNL